MGVSTPNWGPQPRAPELEKDTHITSGSKNQQGFCSPGRDTSLLETQEPFLKAKAQNLICSHSRWALAKKRQSGLEGGSHLTSKEKHPELREIELCGGLTTNDLESPIHSDG